MLCGPARHPMSAASPDREIHIVITVENLTRERMAPRFSARAQTTSSFVRIREPENMEKTAIALAPGQESVWDYPRPPRLEPSTRNVRIEFAGEVIADSTGAFRVLETSHPPTWYIPPADVRQHFLVPGSGQSFCEWKGHAAYASLLIGGRESANAAWFYPRPTLAFGDIRGYYAFYPSRVDACYIDDVRVEAQPGDFYGGWITPDIAGPFKGGPSTEGW